MKNSIFADGDQWKEFRELEEAAEEFASQAEPLATHCSPDGQALVTAALSLGKRIEALTYVVARIGGADR